MTSRWIALIFICLTAHLLAQTQPTTRPTERLKQLISDLNDRDAAARDQAAQMLMSLKSDDLTNLRQAVADARPIFPNQAVLLHEIVTQIYLSDLPYPTNPTTAPCLGVDFRDLSFNTIDVEPPPVRVWGRFPGFSTFQMLRDGDVIVALADQSNTTLNHKNFQEAIHALRVGQVIGLIVSRQGRTFTVYCTLRNQPAGMGDNGFDLDAWTQARVEAADQYWQDHFAGLMPSDAS